MCEATPLLKSDAIFDLKKNEKAAARSSALQVGKMNNNRK